MKQLTYKFKEGDYVDCTNLTDEQVQMILDRMWELGASKHEGLEGRYDKYQILEWQWVEPSRTFFGLTLREDYNQITWEEIMKHEQGVIDWQNICYKLEETDKTVGRIQELSEKMSKVSGYEIEGYIKGFTKSSIELEWNFLICGDEFVELMDGSLSKNSEVTEQQLDQRIKEMSEEAVDTPCLDDVTTWKCFKQVADVLGGEHAEYELKKVLQGYREGTLGTWGNNLYSKDLISAFSWYGTNRSDDFWSDIYEGVLPENYNITPDVPSYNPKKIVPDNDLGECLDNVTEDNKNPAIPLELPSQSVGELVEELYSKLLPSDVTISINGNGQILLHSNTTPVVDVSKLSAEDIDKAYEVLVMLEGCFVEYNESEGE